MVLYNASINYNLSIPYNGVNTAKPFIILPVNISFERWIAELQVDYSTEEVPVYFTESNWREFADATRRLNTFNNDDIPQQGGFSDWRDWAQRLCQALNV